MALLVHRLLHLPHSPFILQTSDKMGLLPMKDHLCLEAARHIFLSNMNREPSVWYAPFVFAAFPLSREIKASMGYSAIAGSSASSRFLLASRGCNYHLLRSPPRKEVGGGKGWIPSHWGVSGQKLDCTQRHSLFEIKTRALSPPVALLGSPACCLLCRTES